MKYLTPQVEKYFPSLPMEPNGKKKGQGSQKEFWLLLLPARANHITMFGLPPLAAICICMVCFRKMNVNRVKSVQELPVKRILQTAKEAPSCN